MGLDWIKWQGNRSVKELFRIWKGFIFLDGFWIGLDTTSVGRCWCQGDWAVRCREVDLSMVICLPSIISEIGNSYTSIDVLLMGFAPPESVWKRVWQDCHVC